MMISIKVIRVAWKVGFVHCIGFCKGRKVATVLEIGAMGVFSRLVAGAANDFGDGFAVGLGFTVGLAVGAGVVLGSVVV